MFATIVAWGVLGNLDTVVGVFFIYSYQHHLQLKMWRRVSRKLVSYHEASKRNDTADSITLLTCFYELVDVVEGGLLEDWS